MAEKSTGKPVEAEANKEKGLTAISIPKFPVSKLRSASIELFGVTSSTFDGAFFGCTKEEMTIEEARARIENWLGKEAK